MRKNELEDKMLNKIEMIEEGLALTLLKAFFAPQVKRAFKSLKEKDPELFADLESLEYYNKRQERRIKKYKKMAKSDNPDEAAAGREMLKLFKK